MSTRESREIVRVRLKGAALRDWDSFWNASAEVFRFGSNFGRNKDAWHECMADLDHPVRDDGSAPFPKDALVLIEYPGRAVDRTVSKEIVAFLLQGCAQVNSERELEGETSMLMCLEGSSG